jgi:hypothetical protein
MSIEKKNMAVLQQKYPEIYEKIVNIKPRTKYRLTPVKGQDHIPNMVDSAGNRFFYSNTDPMGEAERQVLAKQIKVPFFNIFLGTGLMYHFFAFFNVYKVQDSVNIIIEKDLDIFRTLVSCVDITAPLSNPMFYFMLDEEPKSLFTKINRIMHATNAKFHAKSLNFIEDPGAFLINKDYYINAIKIMKESLREVIMFYGNDPFDSLIGIENIFLNIEEIIQNPGIKYLKDRFKGKPGVVISTGPSLNKNIHLLNGLENKAVFCAADASLRVMKKKNLKPHLVTSLERMTPTAKLFEGLVPEDVEDVYFAGAPVIHPQTYAAYPGKRIITYRNFATFQWIGIDRGILDIGPSAGNMAFKVLEYLGCDPIILIGQDLAFGPDDLTHAEGSTYGEKQQAQVFKEVREVEGNYQPKIKTTRVWEMFLQYYHKDVSASKARVINATEGGAKILGAQIMTFQEAIDKYIKDDIDVLDNIKNALHYPDIAEQEADRENTHKIVVNGINYCSHVLKAFDEAINICDEYVKEVFIPFQATNQYNRELGEVYLTKLEEKCGIFQEKEFFEVLMHYLQSYYIRTMIEINGAKSTSSSLGEAQSKNVMHLKDMFRVMGGLVHRMMILMHLLRAKLEEGKKL